MTSLFTGAGVVLVLGLGVGLYTEANEWLLDGILGLLLGWLSVMMLAGGADAALNGPGIGPILLAVIGVIPVLGYQYDSEWFGEIAPRKWPAYSNTVLLTQVGIGEWLLGYVAIATMQPVAAALSVAGIFIAPIALLVRAYEGWVTPNLPGEVAV